MVKKQKSFFDKLIQVMTHSVDKTPNNLSHYDVILAGGVLSWLMTRNLTKVTHGHKMIFYDPPTMPIQTTAMRIPFESAAIKDSQYNMLYSELLDPSMGMNNSAKIKQILPNESAVLMSNGQKLTYGSLIYNTSLLDTPDAIPGLVEGLNNGANRVFSTLPKMTNPLFYSFISLFEHGQAVIYIPEFPFQSEIEHMNFLYALSTWEMNEKLGIGSPLWHLTIINANDRFASQCDVLDKFIRDRLATHSKVTVHFNTKLKSINNKDSTLTLETKDGQTRDMEFKRLYCQVPTKVDPLLATSGLIEGNAKKVPVNPKTLAHGQFENVFVYGENVDVRVQPSLEASLTQASVARHNALEYIDGRSAKAEYNGRSFIPIYHGVHNVALYSADWQKGAEVKPGLLDGWFNYKWAVGSYGKKVRKAFISKAAAPMTRKAPKFEKGDQVRQVAPSEHHH